MTELQRGSAPDAPFDTLLVDEAQDLTQWGFECGVSGGAPPARSLQSGRF